MCILSLNKYLISATSLPFNVKLILLIILFLLAESTFYQNLSILTQILLVWFVKWGSLRSFCRPSRKALFPGFLFSPSIPSLGIMSHGLRVGFGVLQGESGLCLPSKWVRGLLRPRFPSPFVSSKSWLFSLPKGLEFKDKGAFSEKIRQETFRINILAFIPWPLFTSKSC